MSSLANSQLEEIHSMLAAGHHSIRMERHTLILWQLLYLALECLNVRSLIISTGWLAAVILPATLGHYIFVNNNVDNKFSHAQKLSWEAYSQQTDIDPDTLQIVKLPAGTIIPIHLTINSELITNTTEVKIPLVTSQAIQMTIKNGKAEGYFRTETGPWVQRYGIREFSANTVVSNEQGPYVDMRFKLTGIK